MSHFTVMIFGNNAEEQLAPFDEQDADKQFLTFNDQEDEFFNEYETDSVERVVMPDGRLLRTYDEEFRTGGFGFGSHTHKVPEGLEKREVPFKELYPTFEEFVSDYHGHASRDEDTGRYGWWSNPNAKWDWYELGGRWTGMLKLKPNTNGALGRPGLMTPSAKHDHADSALKRDIDFDGMRDDAAHKALTRWDLAHSLMGNTYPSYQTWDTVRETNPDIDVARNIYHEQPAVKALSEHQEFTWEHNDVMCSREEMEKTARDNAIVTFAVLKDGTWYERGEMGWWACVSNEKDNWGEEFNKLLDSMPDDTLISIYDCHI